MNKQALYLAIYQATNNTNAIADITNVKDFQRSLAVHIARNSGEEISHITLEFTGPRSRFLCSILFDGSGDMGTGLDNFAMPKVRLHARQKAVILLACLEFLTEAGVLAAQFEYFRERIAGEYDSSHSILGLYDAVKKNAYEWMATNWDESLKIATNVPVGSENFHF